MTELDKDKLTLRLEGEVSLEDFAKALSSLSALLAELEMEIAGKDEAEIEWRLTGLRLDDDGGKP